MRPSELAEAHAQAASQHGFNVQMKLDEKDRINELGLSVMTLSQAVKELAKSIRYTYNKLDRLEHRR